MINVALAGQPNSGKSTIFNMLAGVNQHVANYPGVTVDKKSAPLNYQGEHFLVTDLPGTYSFSTYSLEERVAKTFLLDEDVDIIVNVVNASSLRRSLYLTFQLLELGKPFVLVLNMMDVARRRKIEINTEKLSSLLNVKIVETVGSKRLGKKELEEAMLQASREIMTQPLEIDYGELESYISEIENEIEQESNLPKRWLAIKALEEDNVIIKKLNIANDLIENVLAKIHASYKQDIEQTIAKLRYENADLLYHQCVKEHNRNGETLTAKIDRIVLNQWLSFPILGFVIYLVYQLAIVGGYKLTVYTWPLLASFKNMIVSFLPSPEFIDLPLVTDFTLWMTDSVIALLNYIPIFFILFALIAIIEDIGYMPRMAFILDRVFKRFGLHGQSTLPLVLGGALVGGCAVPGVMATKGIADERARLATILAVPYMNCLAKVPFYTLLLGAFFKEQMSLMMFFISTVTLFIALIVARLLTLTLLKNRETAPFVMELPAYHLPNIKSVLLVAVQRVWLYIKKVMTIVLAVAAVLFVLLQYPGIADEKMQSFNHRANSALQKFDKKVEKTIHYKNIDEKSEVFALLNLYNDYKARRMLTSSKDAVASLDQSFRSREPVLFALIRPEDKEAKKINKEVRRLSKVSKKLQIEMKNEKISNSFLGMFGRMLEPVTRYAGFDWRINVAFLSSFAARESAVATLGAIYEKGKVNATAGDSIADDGAYMPIHAVAMLIFMILSPPCIATMVVVKLQSRSSGWMLFSVLFPTFFGVLLSSVFFSLAQKLGWDGITMMRNFYIFIVSLTLFLALIKTKHSGWQAGKTKVRG